ncbi:MULTISPECIES: NAD(P)H-dependent flavin oxidoreductase [Cupriavidus]|uniref:2-nitropropane dioxygenase, NPD n=1 Tax=Cupriavidus pinatubonensis (strain JMP 134 / LMG 1197) TaxID=264198 RepID=Q471T1_CUPPJ|nr:MULTISPECIES: nitronate monooxygenase [Cupriavidus]QYY33042.1 nitronate monooxygenase [Cupriavidus pinatubonensis]TPQ39136.1 nitronate monooxygenase [Cupriavidus pinatubonensis]
MSFETALTKALNLRVPVLAGPLGRGSSAEFLGAMADSGSFGFTALMHMPEETVSDELAKISRATNGRFGANLTLIVDQRKRLATALDAGVRVFSMWQGDIEPYVRIIKDAGGLVFWTVGTPEDAARARDIGVDFIVSQGRESGGHLVGSAPTMSLLPAIVDAARGVPVVAAGGVADGRGLVAAMALGACGVWMGTRFVASSESANHRGYKERVVAARATDLVETRLFDAGWQESPHQVIRNSTFSKWEAAGCPPTGQRPGEGEPISRFPNGKPLCRYDVAAAWDAMEGDWEASPLYAGATVELIHDVKPVAEIVGEIRATAEAAFNKVAGLRTGR